MVQHTAQGLKTNLKIKTNFRKKGVVRFETHGYKENNTGTHTTHYTNKQIQNPIPKKLSILFLEIGQ